MGALHWYDLLGLVVLGLVIFGPKKLPEMGSSLGKTIREFQKSMREVTNPEPPTSIPPSASQTAQPVATAAPAPVIALASGGEPRAESATTTIVPAEAHVESSIETPTAAPKAAPVVSEEGVAPRVEEDALR